MTRIELAVPVDIEAPAETAWQVVTDWPAQGEWILGTTVTVDGAGDARGLGGRFSAFTGVGPLGFTDPMEVTEWDPPRRCVVTHLGRVVRGDGVFEVVALGPVRRPRKALVERHRQRQVERVRGRVALDLYAGDGVALDRRLRLLERDVERDRDAVVDDLVLGRQRLRSIAEDARVDPR